MKNLLSVWKEGLEGYRQIGMLSPSSSYLAREMILDISEPNRKNLKILEVGPGTGPITRQIISQLKNDDTLDVVELNENFLQTLKAKLMEEFSPEQLKNVQFHNSAVQDFLADRTEIYDNIVSALPFFSLPQKLVEQIMQTYKNALVSGGTLCWFEYVGLREGAVLLPGTTLEEISRTYKKYFSRLQTLSKRIVWCNFPPARVIRVRK